MRGNRSTQPPFVAGQVHYPPHDLQRAVDGGIADTVGVPALVDEGPERIHGDVAQPLVRQAGVESAQVGGVVVAGSFIPVFLEITNDGVLPRAVRRDPGPSYRAGSRLEADQIFLCRRSLSKPSALAYAASIREDAVDPPGWRVFASVEAFFSGHRDFSFLARPRDLQSSSQASRSTTS